MAKTREHLLAERNALKAMQRELFRTTVENLATSVALRDAYPGDHSRRVTAFSLPRQDGGADASVHDFVGRSSRGEMNGRRFAHAWSTIRR
jgi:hypothetical protein